MIVILVNDGMDHDRLFVYSNGAVRGHCDPVVWHDLCQYLQKQKGSPIQWTNVRHGTFTSLKSQGFTSHEHDIGPLVPPLHLILPGPFTLHPARPRGKIQRRSFVRRAADVLRAHDAMTVRHGEVEQTPLIPHFVPQLRRRGVHEAVDAPDRLQHRLPENRVPEPVERALLAVGVDARLFQTVEEESKGPFAVRGSLDAHEPLVAHAQGDFALDVPPAGDVAVVHEHEAAVGERVAVEVGNAAFGRGAHVGEDEGGGRFGGQAGEVDAVPCGGRAGEDAGVGSEGWWGVVAYAEAVAVVRAAVILDR